MQQERALERRGRAFIRLAEDADQDRPTREAGQGVAHPLGARDRVVLVSALGESRRRGDVVVGAQRDHENVGVVRASVGRHVPGRWVDRRDALLAKLDSRLREVAVRNADCCGVLAAEEDVELREPERERVVPVDEGDANLAGERVGEAARQFQAAEAGSEDQDVLHVGNPTPCAVNVRLDVADGAPGDGGERTRAGTRRLRRPRLGRRARPPRERG